MPDIHPSAVVSDGALLGEGAKVGPYCVVGENAVLGEGVELMSHVVVDGHTRIGARTRVFPFASLGQPPQQRGLAAAGCAGEHEVVVLVHRSATPGGSGARGVPLLTSG